MASIPRIDEEVAELTTIQGIVPSLKICPNQVADLLKDARLQKQNVVR